MSNAAAAKARLILQTHWDGTLPVHIGTIAKAMGVVVRPVEMDNPEICAQLTRGIPQDIPQDIQGGAVIVYNVSETSLRKRFAVAHALGHYVLGHDAPPPETAHAFAATTPDPAEHAANCFAGEILVPHHALAILANSGKMRSVEEMANVFAVSQLLLLRRMSDELPNFAL